MRVLFLVSRDDTNPCAAGGDVMGSTYGRYLAEAGHEVVYLTTSYKGADPREIRHGVEIVRLGRPGTLAWRMYQYYRCFGDGFDIVYEEAFGGARVPFLAPLYVRQPIITPWYQLNGPVFVHQYGRLAGRVLSLFERWVARLHRRASIIALTEERRADLLKLGFRAEQLFVLPPVAIEEMVNGPPDIESRPPTIVWLGKMRRYKCPHDAVRAMRAVCWELPEARLVIAGRKGEGDYAEQLRDEVRRLGLSRNISFEFDISEEEKALLLRQASCLVATSPVEGFGIAILEAAAAGTPAVVSDGVPEEVVRDGYNGLRYPFGDTEALSRALLRVLSSPDARRSLGANASAHARSFSRAALSRKLEALLAAAIEGHGLVQAAA